MHGKGREWAIALGCIVLLSTGLTLAVSRWPGPSLSAELAAQIDRWTQAPVSQAPEQPASTDDAIPQLQFPPLENAVPAPESERREGVPSPRTRPVTWITSDDYPAEALRNNWQGTVAIEWTVDEDGVPRNCKATQSSGHAVLDEASCDLIMRRGSYWPALGKDGKPVPSKDKRRVIWMLPQ